MTSLTFYDAAWPPASPPETDGVCIYIGGDATHVWTAGEIGAQRARYRLPIFVRSNPRGVAGVAPDINAALLQLTAIGAPKGTLVAWDMETAADKAYISGIYAGLTAHGYELIVYGSESTVMGNDSPDGLYWGADWTSQPHLARGDTMTQWVSFSGYDLSVAQATLPFWDTQAPPPKPPVTPPSIPAWQEAIMNKLPTLSEGSADVTGHVFYVHRMQALTAVYGQITNLPEVASQQVNGTFDAATKQAVEAIQSHHGLAVDGIVGPQTWGLLLVGSAT